MFRGKFAVSFHNKEYKAAFQEVEQTLKLISKTVNQKNQKEHQLKEWDRQAEAYQAWEKDPRTSEMRSLWKVFKFPQVKSRLTKIQQGQKRQEQERQARLRQSQQQRQQNLSAVTRL